MNCYNNCLKSCRESVEWQYAKVTNLYGGYLNKPRKLKLLMSNHAKYVFTVAVLFRNFHSMMTGNQTSIYFNVKMPNNLVENYIKGTNVQW